MTQPWFIAVERFGPAKGEAWTEYVQWSKLYQLEDLVTLDALLCPTVLKDIGEGYWPHIVNENFYLRYFTDLEFLRREVASASALGARFLSVLRNPAASPALPSALSSFCFVGFDLVEAESSTSSLSNCGGWPELDTTELSKRGLLTNHARALQLQELLPRNYPNEPHANCDVWAIFAEE